MEARRSGKYVHLGKLFGICVEKGSELPDGDSRKKYKYRVVFQGNRVVDQSMDEAQFQDMATAPRSFSRGTRTRTVLGVPWIRRKGRTRRLSWINSLEWRIVTPARRPWQRTLIEFLRIRCRRRRGVIWCVRDVGSWYSFARPNKSRLYQ